MTKYRVGVETRGENVTAWVFDLPGCRSISGTREETLALVPIAIGEYLAWLEVHHARPLDAMEPFEYEIVEDINVTGDYCFEDDRQPVGVAELDRGIRYIGFAHADLASLLRPLSETVLDWKPPATSVKIDATYADVRTIRDMEAHVATALTFHLRGVGHVTERVPSPDDPQNLQQAYEVTILRLRQLDADERAGTYKRETARGEAEWSARKAIRRIINHVRFHTGEAAIRLAWPTLGVPVVLQGPRE
jgi:predicted RNase H-like HicB family nuclease